MTIPTPSAIRRTKKDFQNDLDVQNHLTTEILKEMKVTAERCALHVYEIPIAIYVDMSSHWSSRWCFEDVADSLDEKTDSEMDDSVADKQSKTQNDRTHLVDRREREERGGGESFSTNTSKVCWMRVCVCLY